MGSPRTASPNAPLTLTLAAQRKQHVERGRRETGRQLIALAQAAGGLAEACASIAGLTSGVASGAASRDFSPAASVAMSVQAVVIVAEAFHTVNRLLSERRMASELRALQKEPTEPGTAEAEGVSDAVRNVRRCRSLNAHVGVSFGVSAFARVAHLGLRLRPNASAYGRMSGALGLTAGLGRMMEMASLEAEQRLAQPVSGVSFPATEGGARASSGGASERFRESARALAARQCQQRKAEAEALAFFLAARERSAVSPVPTPAVNFDETLRAADEVIRRGGEPFIAAAVNGVLGGGFLESACSERGGWSLAHARRTMEALPPERQQGFAFSLAEGVSRSRAAEADAGARGLRRRLCGEAVILAKMKETSGRG